MPPFAVLKQKRNFGGVSILKKLPPEPTRRSLRKVFNPLKLCGKELGRPDKGLSTPVQRNRFYVNNTAFVRKPADAKDALGRGRFCGTCNNVSLSAEVTGLPFQVGECSEKAGRSGGLVFLEGSVMEKSLEGLPLVSRTWGLPATLSQCSHSRVVG